MSLSEFSETDIISSFIQNASFATSRKLFVLGVLLPYEHLILTRLSKKLSTRSKQDESFKVVTFTTFDQIIGFDIPLINVDEFNYDFLPEDQNLVICKNEKQSLAELLQITTHTNLSQKHQTSLFKVWNSLADIDLNSKKDIHDWLIYSLPLLPKNISKLPEVYLYNAKMSYLTMLLMLTSFGEYPIWLSRNMGKIPLKYSKIKSNNFWVNCYMDNVLANFKNLQSKVSRQINRSVDPIDIVLYYLVTIRTAPAYNSDSYYRHNYNLTS